MKRTDDFLGEHRLKASDIDMENLVEVFIKDMIDGLSGKEGTLRMIPTYIEAENDFLTEVPVLAIDAGGTNFRASVVKFSGTGQIESGEIISYRMPGLKKEVSAKEFFSIIAGYIKPLADRSQRIGFCFSYPTEILPNRDGRLIQFCKEVQAPEVVGQLIGKNLLETLGTPEKKLVILNDTVATLLAGKSESFNRSYDTFIGYILGTGTNTCYIESNSNITKNKDLDRERSQIINIESGNFKRGPRTDLDIVFDNSTIDPGNYTFEKMFSGGYFGGLCLTVLKSAAIEGVFSRKSGEKLAELVRLSSNEANNFVINPYSHNNILNNCLKDKRDIESASEIINSLIERAAKLVAANLIAVVLRTGNGKSPDRPVLITVEGTAFYKLNNLKTGFEELFNSYLSGDNKRYVEFTRVDQSGLRGAALAALID